MAVRAFGIFGALALAGCKRGQPTTPRPQPVDPQTLAITGDAHAVRGVAGDGSQLYAALAGKQHSIVEARSAGRTLWSAELTDGVAGELAMFGPALAVALATHGEPRTGPATGSTVAEVRGDPGAVVIALDRTTGARRWSRPLESTEWVLVTAMAAVDNDLVVAGSFGGTLRIGAKVVTSGGGADGFLARVAADGSLAWLVRLGGAGADAVQGVAVAGDPKSPRIAIAGTFSLGADILGAPLASIDLKSPFADAFVAEFDGAGARRWSSTFGSRGDDAVAGVAIDASGDVIVAANVHEVLSIAGTALVPRGTGDGLVVWYRDGGEVGTAVLVGGNDFDGIRSIAAVGNEAIVGGFFSGSLQLADLSFTAGGGDDSFIAAIDPSGTVTTAWHVGGGGREEITSLQAVPGGFVAGIAHTRDAAIDGAKLAPPPAGTTASAVVVRGR